MIKLFEKFTEETYSNFKKKEEEKLFKKFGNKNTEKFVEDGDIDGLNYLLSNGYDFTEYDFDQNLLVIAIKNNQLETLDFLLKTNYAPDYDNAIDSIILSDIIGPKDYSNPNIITKEIVEQLKVITKYGYNFGDNSNLIDLYLMESSFNNNSNSVERIFIKGVIPFIDWLLKNYPRIIN